MIVFLTHSAMALTGREIMDKCDRLTKPVTVSSKVLMFIHNGENVTEKEFVMESKKIRENESKALISFTRPSKIKILTYSHPTGEDDQWLMMTSGKAKRIATADKSKSFVNSHFSYEDLSSRRVDDYDYTLNGEVAATGADCFKVEATKKTGPKVYDKCIFYIRKSDYFVVKVDFFATGKYIKTLENSEIKEIKGILTPHKIVMTDAVTKDKTELKVQSVIFNAEMSDSRFNKDALR
jgi:hypothetical protein